MENRCIDEVSKILKEAGKLVVQKPEENTAELRQSVRSIEILVQESGNKHLLFLSYFLSFFIEDVWSNIAMDASYKISDDDIGSILSCIGTDFIKIGENLERREYYRCYDDYVNLLHTYFNSIKTIKGKIRDRYGK